MTLEETTVDTTEVVEHTLDQESDSSATMSGWGGATNFVIIGDDDDDDTPQVVEPNQELNEDTKTKFETKMFSEPGELSKDEYEEEMFSYSHKKPSISTGQSLLKKRLAEAEIIDANGKRRIILIEEDENGLKREVVNTVNGIPRPHDYGFEGCDEGAEPTKKGRKKTLDFDDPRPKPSYHQLIRRALIEHPRRKMTLNEIYLWFATTYPYYASRPAPNAQWKNSLRHHLSVVKCFVKDSAHNAHWSFKTGLGLCNGCFEALAHAPPIDQSALEDEDQQESPKVEPKEEKVTWKFVPGPQTNMNHQHLPHQKPDVIHRLGQAGIFPQAIRQQPQQGITNKGQTVVEVGRNKFVNPSSLLNAKPTVTGVGRPLIGPGTTKVTNMGITTSTTVPLIVVGSNVPAASTNQTSLPVLANNTNIIGKPLNYGTHQQLQPVVKTDNDDEDDDVTIIDEEFNPDDDSDEGDDGIITVVNNRGPPNPAAALAAQSSSHQGPNAAASWKSGYAAGGHPLYPTKKTPASKSAGNGPQQEVYNPEIHGGSEIPPVKSNYHILIRSALIGCHKGADPHRSVLTPSEIYGWCQRKYTYYADRDSYNASWKSALRHHLTASKCFTKGNVGGKTGWTFNARSELCEDCTPLLFKAGSGSAIQTSYDDYGRVITPLQQQVGVETIGPNGDRRPNGGRPSKINDRSQVKIVTTDDLQTEVYDPESDMFGGSSNAKANRSTLASASAVSAAPANPTNLRPGDRQITSDYYENRGKKNTVTGRPTADDPRPNISYHELLRQAISETKRGRATPGDLYVWCQSNFGFYARRSDSTASWKSALRHHLSMSKCFARDDPYTEDTERERTAVSSARGGFWRFSDNTCVKCSEAKHGAAMFK